MIKLSNSLVLLIFTKLLILLLVAKAISLAIWAYLPSDGVELAQTKSYQPKYQRVDFKNMIQNSRQESRTASPTSKSVSITNMILKGLYGKNDSGFVIVALKSSQKATSIVEVGEVFSGFTLKSIAVTSAMFTKNSKEYILELEKVKSKGLVTKASSEEDSSEPKSVQKSDISFYEKNPKQIWKDIAIQEIKNGQAIEGFKVTRIAKNSKMADLGLKKGDIIIKANNIELKSYKSVMDIYSKISTLDTIQIVVMRNNQEKELVYEIR